MHLKIFRKAIKGNFHQRTNLEMNPTSKTNPAESRMLSRPGQNAECSEALQAWVNIQNKPSALQGRAFARRICGLNTKTGSMKIVPATGSIYLQIPEAITFL